MVALEPFPEVSLQIFLFYFAGGVSLNFEGAKMGLSVLKLGVGSCQRGVSFACSLREYTPLRAQKRLPSATQRKRINVKFYRISV